MTKSHKQRRENISAIDEAREAGFKEAMIKISQALSVNSTSDFRKSFAQAVSGGYHGADRFRDVFNDYGYPESLNFSHFWNMYRRFGIATAGVEAYPDYGWSEHPTISTTNTQLVNDLSSLMRRIDLWVRLKGLDVRQRVGRYAGAFMRVRDGKKPNEPIDGVLPGIDALVDVIPLYESQLEVSEVEQNTMSDNYGQPIMYHFRDMVDGSRSEKSANSFDIHPSRVVISAEGADNGSIYGIPCQEPVYNSLMDLVKILGAGGEGFYKNAAQKMVFQLEDASTASVNKDLLEKFTDQYDDFIGSFNKAFMSPGLSPKQIESSLISNKEFVESSMFDVSAGFKVPTTILIGRQTGKLASTEDNRSFLNNVNSRRENHQSTLVGDVIDWMMINGCLPMADYQIEWGDALALSEEQKLGNAERMSDINAKAFNAGQSPVFTSDEIREAAGFQSEPEDIPSEELDLDDAEENEG